MLGIL